MITFSGSLSNILMLLFLLMVLAVTVYSSILIYHWRTYGESTAVTASTTTVYLIGVACLLGSMAIAIFTMF